MESIIFYHLMEVSDQGKYTILPITDLYDIIDVYKKISKDDKKKYLRDHYEKIDEIAELYNILNDKYPNLKWLLNHFVYHNSESCDYEIYKKFSMIAHNENTVLICHIKPQFNKINYNQIILESIFDNYLIANVQKSNEDKELSPNYKRFNGKKIITCIISSDLKNPYIFDWTNVENKDNLVEKNNENIKNIIKKNLQLKFEIYNNDVYLFYKYCFEKFKSDNYDSNRIINKIINEYNEIKEKHIFKIFPGYIDQFFSDIKGLNRRDKKDSILKKYLDEKVFISEITCFLNESIDEYFN